MSSDLSLNKCPWWQPGVFDYGKVELFVMRLLFAVLIYVSIKWETGAYLTQRIPNGLAHFFDLTWLGEHPPGMGWKVLTIAGLLMYVVGLLPALGLLPISVFAVLIGTLVTTKAPHHSWQLVTMILLAQGLVYAWPRNRAVHRALIALLWASLAAMAAWYLKTTIFPMWGERSFGSFLGRLINPLLMFGLVGGIWHWLAHSLREKKREVSDSDPLALHRLAVYASTVVFAASYVVCGIMKLVNSDLQWIQKVPLLSVQLLKTNWNKYYDELQPVPEWLAWATQAIVDYPNLARLFFGMGLLIELAGFVILISRKWAFFGGLVIIAMHLSISAVMQLDFIYHIAAALIFAVNLPGVMKTFGRR